MARRQRAGDPPGHPLRVLVVGPRHPGEHSRGGMATVVGLMREHRDPRVRLRTVATYVDHVAAVRWATAGRGLLLAVLLLVTRRVDVLHVHLAHRGSVVRKAVPLLVARAVGVPAVVHAHSYDFAAWFDQLPRRGQALVRALLPARAWLVLGEGLVASYGERLRLAPGSVRSLHNPAPPVRPARPERPGDGTRLQAVALGRVGRRKGSYDLLDAVERLDPATRAALAVVLAGDGEVAEVRAEIARRGLGDVVEAPGWLAAPERDALLDTAAVLLLPSHAEGLPMAMLEAMAAGLVPVVSDVGAVGEVARDDVNAVLVPPGDPAALAEALRGLVADPGRRERLADGARETAAGMSEPAWFEALVEVWTRLSQGRPHR